MTKTTHNSTKTPLERIEDIVSDDFCDQMETYLVINKTLNKNEQIMAKKIIEVYKISHANNKHTCTHNDWL